LDHAEARAANAEIASTEANKRARREAAAEVEVAKKKVAVAEAEAAKKKAATDMEATQKKVAADAAKDMAAMQQKLDTAYKVLSRFNLLHEVVVDTPSATTAQENVAPLQQAILAGDTGAAKIFLDLRSSAALPLHEVCLDWHVSAKAVDISGVTNGSSSVHFANGHYAVVSGETCGGKPVFKKEDGDVWIEYWSAAKRWHVKIGASDRGTVSCCMQSQDAEATQFPWEAKDVWEVYISTKKALEPQLSATVTQWVLSVTISGVTNGSGPAHTANGHYVVVSGETCGGKPVFKKEDDDVWIEYWSAAKRWHVKFGASARGTVSCCMQSSDERPPSSRGRRKATGKSTMEPAKRLRNSAAPLLRRTQLQAAGHPCTMHVCWEWRACAAHCSTRALPCMSALTLLVTLPGK